MAFKMKGNPMQRNFGIGSPAKQTYDANGTDERVYDVNQEKYDAWRGTEDINTGEKGNAPNIRYLGSKENKKHLDAYLEFKKSGGKKVSPKEGTTIKNPGARGPGPEVKTTTVIKSSKKKSPSKQFEEGDYYDTRSKSPSKQFEEGDYYDTRSKSPNKQTYYGGTESEKGNIFTKKGREQRKVNKFKKTQKKLLDNVNKEGYDTKKSKRLMKKTNKRLSKTSQTHQDVQSGKKVIYKGGDPKDNSNYISNQN